MAKPHDALSRLAVLHRSFLAALLLAGVWLSMALAVNPLGEFPLNDDWSYAQTVKTLVTESRVQLNDWTSMPLIVQVLWGALFCLPAGFSFTALRLSTLVLGLVGLWATYGLLREAHGGVAWSLMGALAVAANPLYFQLSNTFMTDVPFVACALVSLWLLVRGMKQDSWRLMGLGLLVAYLATLIRQTGLAIPAAFGLWYGVRAGRCWGTLIIAAAPTVLGLALLWLYRAWLQETQNLPRGYDQATLALNATLSRTVVEVLSLVGTNVFNSLIYLGLFLLPLTLVVAAGLWSEQSRRQKAVGVAAVLGVNALGGAVLYAQRRLMPLMDNIIFDLGLGPLTLRDTYHLNLPHYAVAPTAFWLSVTLLGVVGAALLLLCMGRALRDGLQARDTMQARVTWLVTFVAIIYFAPLALIHTFDRYLLLLLPLLLVLVATLRLTGAIPRAALGVSLALWLLMLVFTTAGTHDYLAWNRARWQGLRELTEQAHVPPTEIDGGFEFNSWYLFPQYYQTPWALYHDQYVVTFAPIEGYVVVKPYPFQRWLSLDEAQILVMRKSP